MTATEFDQKIQPILDALKDEKLRDEVMLSFKYNNIVEAYDALLKESDRLDNAIWGNGGATILACTASVSFALAALTAPSANLVAFGFQVLAAGVSIKTGISAFNRAVAHKRSKNMTDQLALDVKRKGPAASVTIPAADFLRRSGIRLS